MRVPLLLGLVLAGGCNVTVSDAVPDVPVDESFTLAPGESVEIEGADLRVRFLEVRGDSRCPADVECVWEGDAEVVVETVREGLSRVWHLHTAGEKAGGSPSAEVGEHVLRLVGVAPQPRTDGPIAQREYRVTFRVVTAQ